jgi:ABC-type amino acid transport substrate-binding protein
MLRVTDLRHRVRLSLLIAAALFVAASAQTSRLRLVSTAWPPFTNAPGQPRFALDLVEAAFGRIGLTSATSIVDAAQFTTSLLEGPFDGSAAAWKDAARERALIFSQPYLENRLILVGRTGSDVTATKLNDLRGKRIAIVAGYSYGDGVDLTGPVFVRTASEEQCLEQLLASKVDYTLMDELVVQYITTHHAAEAKSRLRFGRTPLMTRPLYLAVRRSLPDAAAIVDKFNAQLRGMIADRTYHKLLHVDWIVADVDGDGLPEYVPKSDEAGAAPPQLAYTVNVTPETATAGTKRFYVGGKVYNGWNEVPESYKVSPGGGKSPDASTLTYFRFTWK